MVPLNVKLDLPRFYRVCNPSKALVVGKAEDSQYYIDFSSVRGGKIIEELRRMIARISPDAPTCQLFTGHIGCGKSTELLRLKAELEHEGFHVIYFESSEVLDMADVDISDILLVIARQVSRSLEEMAIPLNPRGFKVLLKEVAEFLQRIGVKIELPVPGIGNLAFSAESEGNFSLSLGIATITAKTKESSQLRSQLREYLEPRTSTILQSMNELLGRGTEELKQQGKRGLVVIVDNLDRVDIRPKPSGRLQPEYLFIDRGEQLRKLNCHVIYTIPLPLIFSNDWETLRNRLGGGVAPKVLPMVPAQLRDGSDCQKGMALLRQMVLARAFPNLPIAEQLGLITEVFDSPETLDRLCRVSGGHVRNLLGLLYRCLQQEDPPFSRDSLENVIKEYRDDLLLAITDDKWELLRQVVQQQSLGGEPEYQTLLRSMFVFEYRDSVGRWFGINPALAEAKQFQQ